MVPPSDPSLAQLPEDSDLGVRTAFERAYGAGELVFDAGEPGGTLYVIHSGEIELTRPGPDGLRCIGRLGPGEVFGERSVLFGEARTLRAVALSDAQLLELDRATFERMCLERPQIALAIIERLAVRMRVLEQRIAALGFAELLRPVVRVLLRDAQRVGAETRVETSLRRVSAETGLSMLKVHQALDRLFQRKLLHLLDDSLVVPDSEALAACLDE